MDPLGVVVGEGGGARFQSTSVSTDGGGGPTFQGTMVMPGSSWALSEESFSIDAGGSAQFQVHVFFPAADGGCILVDDVALLRQ